MCAVHTVCVVYRVLDAVDVSCPVSPHSLPETMSAYGHVCVCLWLQHCVLVVTTSDD